MLTRLTFVDHGAVVMFAPSLFDASTVSARTCVSLHHMDIAAVFLLSLIIDRLVRTAYHDAIDPFDC